jgi:hypothetical protein
MATGSKGCTVLGCFAQASGSPNSATELSMCWHWGLQGSALSRAHLNVACLYRHRHFADCPAHLFGSVPLLTSPTTATRMLYTTRNTAPTATSGDKLTSVLHALPKQQATEDHLPGFLAQDTCLNASAAVPVP